MPSGPHLAIACLSFLIAALPAAAQDISVFKESTETVSIDTLLKNNPLSPEENIRSTLVHQTAAASIHLVQIRDKEKPHIHKTHDLIVTLKRGHGVLRIGRDTVLMKAGDTVVIPRGVIHDFENWSDKIAVALGIFTPPYDGQDMIPVDRPK